VRRGNHCRQACCWLRVAVDFLAAPEGREQAAAHGMPPGAPDLVLRYSKEPSFLAYPPDRTCSSRSCRE